MNNIYKPLNKRKQQPNITNTHFRTHTETTPDIIHHPPKHRFNDNDLKQRINSTQRNTYGIKIVTTPNESTIGKILASTDDCPIYKERFHHKKAINGGILSKYYTKLVSKRLMLPHQVDPPKHERDKTPPPVNKETFNKLFGMYDMKNNNNGNSGNRPIVDLSEFKKKRINKGKKDNVGKIISYENGPKYRDNYKIATKPNKYAFNDIVKGIKQNQRDVCKYYEYNDK